MLRAERLGKELGLRNLLLKDESRNPTGSFMDRGSTVLVSLAKQRGIRECTCVTTGNLGASLAAYCAKAGISARVRIQPSTDRGKLYQMLAYGAKLETPGAVETPAPSNRSLSVTAGNPYLLEGEKTTCFEVVQDLDWKVPDVFVVPIGTGGHLSMIWHAITQLRRSKLTGGDACRLLGVQIEGTAPHSATGGHKTQRTTAFTELEDSEPYFRKEAVGAIKESGGLALATSANATIEATGLLAKTEGIFAEPASASVIACLTAATERGYIRRSETVVCVITGAGLKDTKAVSRLAREARRVSVREDYSLRTPQVGETKLELLRMLGTRSTYGYELWKELASRRKLTTASIYQHLAELEGLGLVRRAGSVTAKGRDRVVYEITRKGAEFVSVAKTLERESPMPGR